MKEIDIVDIKVAVREKKIRFFIRAGFIYASNNIGEVVKVGEVTGGKTNASE